MTFKRMMVLGAMASALAFTACQDRSRSEQDVGAGGAGDQSQQVPATGGSGQPDTIPGSTDTIGGTKQDSQQGTDLGGTGAEGGTLDDSSGTGGSSLPDDQTDDTRKDQNINR